MRVKLFKFQIQDVRKMLDKKTVLNANPMGLGKTIETIVATERLFRDGRSRALIICPAPLIGQWVEFIKHITNTPFYEMSLTKIKRELVYINFESGYIITSYETLKNDIDIVRYMHFDIIVCDEAQKIKNFRTQNTKAVKLLNKSEFRWALTGTPIENNPIELYCIMQWVNKEVFGNWMRFEERHIIRNYFGRPINYMRLKEIGKNIKPFLVRNKKSIVKIPPKLYSLHRLSFSKSMQKIYKEIESYFNEMLDSLKGNEQEDIINDILGGKMLNYGKRRSLEIEVFRAGMALRTMCIDPRLLELSESEKVRDFVKGKKLQLSPKISLLIEIFSGTDEKIVVFSRSKKMIQILEKEVKRRFGKSSVVRYDGGMKMREKENARKRFINNSGIQFFLATDAGRRGLNLQVANILINFEPHLNPAMQEQGEDRIHRIGGGKALIVSFIMRNTIEERVVVKQDKKKSYSKIIFGN